MKSLHVFALFANIHLHVHMPKWLSHEDIHALKIRHGTVHALA